MAEQRGTKAVSKFWLILLALLVLGIIVYGVFFMFDTTPK